MKLLSAKSVGLFRGSTGINRFVVDAEFRIWQFACLDLQSKSLLPVMGYGIPRD